MTPGGPSALAQLLDLGLPVQLLRAGAVPRAGDLGGRRSPRRATVPERGRGHAGAASTAAHAARLERARARVRSSLLGSLDDGRRARAGTPRTSTFGARIVRGWAIEIVLVGCAPPASQRPTVDLFARCTQASPHAASAGRAASSGADLFWPIRPDRSARAPRAGRLLARTASTEARPIARLEQRARTGPWSASSVFAGLVALAAGSSPRRPQLTPRRHDRPRTRS